MRAKSLIILFVTILSSCTIPMRLFNPSGGFAYKFDGQNTGLDTLINLQGYYRYAIPNSSIGYINHDIKFSSNGLICSTYSDNFEKTFVEEQVFWGRYILSGDTIRGQIIVDEGLVGGISSSSFIFLIQFPNSIKDISEKVGEKKNRIYEFQPLGNEPDWKNCWLLKKEWFWKKGYFLKR